ncbi:MAG: sorbosone dehydrogenase family protein [Rhizomicrobium sp.]
MRLTIRQMTTIAAALMLAACGRGHPVPAGSYGAHPVLPAPDKSLLPTVNFSSAEAWPAGAAPLAPKGFTVTRFAEGLAHPRWIYVLPNGDVLVAESSTVPGPPKSLQDRLQAWLQRNEGSRRPSANRITLLRASDGKVVTRTIFLSGLNQPFGMALAKGFFYVANTDGVWRYPYRDGETAIADKGEKILSLPAGGYNNHWTRNLMVSADGNKLFVTVGSSSNVGENGIAEERRRANVIEINLDGSGEHLVASGMRNPNGLGYEPKTGALWTVVNERDMLGDDLVPDYLTRVRDGDFYGWPWSYWGGHVDERVKPPRPDLVAKAIAPDYALGPHVAPLGMTFYTGDAFPAHYRGGLFVGEHGSWNRAAFSGYRVVYVPFANGMPSGAPEDFLTGFLHDPDKGIAYGRPVGVAVDHDGALLVADDTGNIVWRVAAMP